ncbi:MAG: AAA family ATPase [Verrucomicrobia bacterium]|nr:MAG: AAA family ATPase [Verrucomicrobiota bacterium]
MLTRLKVDGFKNLVGVDVRFGPFTCIAGENGTGKSNLFDAIRFLSRLAAGKTLLEAANLVRDEAGRSGDARGLFHRVGKCTSSRMSFELEMIVPPEAVDDLGQRGVASTTFLRYRLELGLRPSPEQGGQGHPLEILREELAHINLGEAREHLLFPHDAKHWRKAVVSGRRGAALISTESSEDGGEPQRLIKMHQDGLSGRPRGFLAGPLPRTVLSSAQAAESPTALCARREMEGWQVFQLEPAAMRRPDDFEAEARLRPDGGHLAATLARLVEPRTPKPVPAPAAAELSSAGAGAPAEGIPIGPLIANRLAELVGDAREIRVDRDEKRQVYTVFLKTSDGTEFPARSLSDGTLRVLALAAMEWDDETPGVICLEEPENGIHPERVRAIVMLLQAMAVDPRGMADTTNPLRQVIVNTHSPSVVGAVPRDCLLLARSIRSLAGAAVAPPVEFVPLPNTWRTHADSQVRPIAPGELLGYLDPMANARKGEMGPDETAVVRQPEFPFLNP